MGRQSNPRKAKVRKMEKKYIFIAYKPDSSDYCRSCLMANYSSDFKIFKDLSYDELLKNIAQFETYDSRCGETGYETYCFCQTDDDVELDYDKIDAIKTEIKNVCAAEKVKKEQEEKQRRQAAIEKEEKALLEKLKNKYVEKV